MNYIDFSSELSQVICNQYIQVLYENQHSIYNQVGVKSSTEWDRPSIIAQLYGTSNKYTMKNVKQFHFHLSFACIFQLLGFFIHFIGKKSFLFDITREIFERKKREPRLI